MTIRLPLLASALLLGALPAFAQTQAPAPADAAPYAPAHGIPAPAADPALQAPALSEEAALDLYGEDIPF